MQSPQVTKVSFSTLPTSIVPEYAKKLPDSHRILTRIDLANLPERSGYGASIRAGIFDIYGTLQCVGSEGVIGAYQELFKTHAGIEISREVAGKPLGKHKRDHLFEIGESQEVKDAFQRKHGRPITQADLEKLYSFFSDIQLDILAQKKFNKPIPGALELIDYLRFKPKPCKIITTTGFTAGLAISSLQSLIKPDLALDADQVQRGRPYPDMVLLALAITNIAPSHAIKFGDTNGDTLEGKRANTWTVSLSLTSFLTGAIEEELHKMNAEQIIKANQLATEKLLVDKPHFVASGIWDVIPIFDFINTLSEKGFHPHDFQEEKAVYKPARLVLPH
jgi:phosphonoacetaldehyde hydrolase